MKNSYSKTSKIKILKRSEPVPKSLLKPEFGILKSKSQKNKTVMTSGESELKSVEPKVQEGKSKTSSTMLEQNVFNNKP